MALVLTVLPAARPAPPVTLLVMRGSGSRPSLLPRGKSTSAPRDTVPRRHALHTTPVRQVAVTVLVVPAPRLPTSFSLTMSGPNPAVDAAALQFTCTRVAAVTIKVMSITGQTVATPVNGSYGPGTYRVVWNGAQDDGRRAPPGLYFVHMRSGAFEATRKVILRR